MKRISLPRHREENRPPGLIGPDAVEVGANRVKAQNTWCQTLAIKDYPREVRAGWLQPLLTFSREADVALHIEPLPAKAAADRLRRQRARLESTRRLDEKRSRLTDPALDAAALDAEDLAGRLARGEDRLFGVGSYVTVRAATEPELDDAVDALEGVCGSLLLEESTTTFRALEGFVTTLPLGLDALRHHKTFDTRALATTFPFASAEVGTEGGILIGRNTASGGLVFWDRFAEANLNHSQVILAQSGAGKSYFTKLIVLRSLFDGIEAIVIDPEAEYGRLARAVGGTVIDLGSPGCRLNPLDLVPERGDQALAGQQETCRVLCAQLVGELSGEEQQELDRALHAANLNAGITLSTQTHMRLGPSLCDVVEELSDTPPAQSLAARLRPVLATELNGLFDGPTTVAPAGHLVVLSLRELRGQVPEGRKKALSFVARDWVWKRVRFGPARPRVVVVDEAWLLLKHDPAAATLLEDLARSTRKQKCGLVTVTQNVADVAGTSLGEAVLENAGCAVLLGQHAHAVDAVGDALALSEGEREHIRTCPKGHGLFISGPERAALEVIASSDEHVLAASLNTPEDLQAMEQAS